MGDEKASNTAENASNNAADVGQTGQSGYLMYVSDSVKANMPNNIDAFSNPDRFSRHSEDEGPKKIRVMRDSFIPKMIDMPFFFIGAVASIGLIGYGFRCGRTPGLEARSSQISSLSFMAQAFTVASMIGYYYRGERRRKAQAAEARNS